MRPFIYFCFFLTLFPLSIIAESKSDNSKIPAAKEILVKDVVKDLTATLSSDTISIELNWKQPTEEGDIIIARSSEIIDSYEKLGVSDSLGKYKSDKANKFTSFRDTNLRSGDHYYAIVLVSQVKKKKVILIANQNYTLIPVTVPERVEKEILIPKIEETEHRIDSVSNLKIRKDENLLRLSWTPPLEAEDTNPVYTVYRSLDPFSNEGLFDKAEKLLELGHPDTTFIDEKLTKSETYYYAVTVSLKNKEYKNVEENKSYRKIYFAYTEKKPEEIKAEKILEEKKETLFVGSQKITDIKSLKRKDGVLLSWTPPTGAVNNSTIYTIYESTLPMSGEMNSILSGKSKKLGTVIHPDSQFLHPLKNQTEDLYFGVTVTPKDGTEEKNLDENISFKKITKKKQKSESVSDIVKPKSETKFQDKENPDFDEIYKNYFKKNKFKVPLSYKPSV